MKPLSRFIDMKDVGNMVSMKKLNHTELDNVLKSYKKIKSEGGNPGKDHYVLNVGGTSPHYNLDYSPCLTRARCGSKGYWLSWLKRKIKTSEMWALQGLPKDSFIEDVVTENQLGKIIGNAIPIPMLAAVMRSVFEACQFQ